MDSHSQHHKILIVEDDTFLQSLLAQKISSKGYVLFTSKEGPQALEIAKKEQPHIILLDILLPGMNGFDILEELKNAPETKESRIIMLSNLGQQSDIDHALELGASMYLVKANTSPDEIVSKIEEIIK